MAVGEAARPLLTSEPGAAHLRIAALPAACLRVRALDASATACPAAAAAAAATTPSEIAIIRGTG